MRVLGGEEGERLRGENRKVVESFNKMCLEDTGKPDFNQYDIECWIPAQNRYRETHTSDYMTDFQARRLNIRYKDKTGKNQYVHMNEMLTD